MSLKKDKMPHCDCCHRSVAYPVTTDKDKKENWCIFCILNNVNNLKDFRIIKKQRKRRKKPDIDYLKAHKPQTQTTRPTQIRRVE